jgi:arabinoxylan arabinofuranohydrolase
MNLHGLRYSLLLAIGFGLCGPIGSSLADYPLLSHRYLADPDGLEYNGRLYLYCSNDDDNPVGGGYSMTSIVCISTDDLKNWTDHGVVFRVPQHASWASFAWAPTVTFRNGLFYLYFGNNANGIGVATNASPTGPFTDARGSALITSSTPGASGTSQWYFDPCVFVDDDSQAWLYFGGNNTNNARVVPLNNDMISLAGPAGALGFVTNFLEAAYMRKRNGIYYFSYEANTAGGLWIRYATNSTPAAGFIPGGNVLSAPSNGNNNHAAFLTFAGGEYVAYHNRYLAMINGLATNTYRRNVCFDAVVYNANGSIQQVNATTNGLTQLKNLNPFKRVEAETMAQQSGITTEPCSEGGLNVTSITNGDWTMVRGVSFGSSGATGFTARVASAAGGGSIELRLDSLAGTLIGTCAVPATGGTQTWTTASCPVSGATGVHDVFFKFSGSFNFNYWQFQSATPPLSAPASLSATAVSSNQINLSWPASAGATSYHVKRSLASGGPYFVAATGLATNSFSDTKLASGTTYYYVVSAENADGESANSPQASALTAPAAPTGLTAIRGNNQVALSWVAATGAASYRVKRATVSGGPYATIASGVATTNYTDTTTANTTTYYYVVSATNATAESANSAEAVSTTAGAFAFEAEAGALGVDWAVSNSAGTVYLTILTDLPGNAPSNAARVATYTLAFPSAGTYQLYARVRVGPDTFNDDSLFYGNGFGFKSPTSGGDWVLANGLAAAGFTNTTAVVTGGGSLGSGMWKWINLSQLTGSAGFTVDDGNLTQIFQIGGRENGLDIDKFVFGSASAMFTVGQLDALLATTNSVSPTNVCTVDGNDLRQRMDGFGGGVVFLDAGLDLNDSNSDTLFKMDTTNQLGLTLLRVRIAPNSTWASGSVSAWINSRDQGRFAVARGARVVATPWTPPASMKDNNNTVNGRVLPAQYATFANYLNTYATFMKTSGVQLAAISVENEPDIVVTYEACQWSPYQLQTFCRYYAGVITNAPLMMPESFRFDFAMSDWTLNDPAAATNVAVIGGHLYGATIQDYPLARSLGKPIWQTEYLINDQTWSSALSTARQIHDCLTIGNMSAYIWWKCLGNTNGLLNAAGVPQKRGFMMAQFSRFVRPGFYRIGAANSGLAAISAYKDPVSNLFAIVVINDTANIITQQFNLTGLTASAVTPWITSATSSLAVQPPITISNSSFTAIIQPSNVVTFAGTAIPAPPNGLTATALSASQINLGWTTSAGATSYNLKRATVSGGPYTTLTNCSATGFMDTGLAAGTPYYYAVSALNAGGESANSSQASATTWTTFQAWQMTYFGCTNCPAADPNTDSDGDGMSNTNEFLAGTNPTNSASAFRILLIERAGNDIVVSWQTASGRTNVLQAADGEYSTNFTDISGLIAITGTQTNYTDTSAATNVLPRFYRVRLVP